jgi:TPR repeat protein
MTNKSKCWALFMALLACGVFPARADFASGLNAYQQGDYSRALKEWQPLADSGEASAQFNLGLMYYEGQGVTKDYSRAADWFRRAANQDYEKAQYDLGALYGVGKGVKRDYVEAFKWLDLCAGKGDSKCAGQRDLVAKKLNTSQLATAQRLASEWKPKKERVP